MTARARGRKTFIGLLLAAATVAVALLLPSIAHAGGPQIWTGKADYSPGEVVDIHGSGFAANTTYAMPVKRPDTSIVNVDPATHLATFGWQFATSDNFGNLSYNYQLDGIYGFYEARAYPEGWMLGAGEGWNEAPVASTTFTDAPTITAKNHEGQLKVGGVLDGYTDGNTNTYTEGDYINFRFTLQGDANTSGNMQIRFTEDDGTCLFFDPYFEAGTYNGPAGDEVVVTSGAEPTVSQVGPITVAGSGTSNGEYVLVLHFAFTTANTATINYNLRLSQEAGECTGASQHSRLNNALVGGGDFGNIGSNNQAVPANQIIELPEIVVTKRIDRDGNGTFEATASAGEYCFTLDSGSCTPTNSSGQVTFINVTPNGAHSITETQQDFIQGTYAFVSGSGTNCAFNGSTATATVASGTTSTDAACTFNNRLATASLKVVKDLVPDNDAGRFDLKIDNTTFNNSGAGYGDGGNTGFQTVTVGQHTVSEVAHTGTSLPNYDSKVTCDSSKGSVDPGTSLQITLAAGDQVMCTITNSRKAEIKVVKDLVPNSDTGTFDLSIDATSYDNMGAGFGDNGTTGFHNVGTGSHTVSELGHGTTSLGDYASKVECDSGKGSDDPGTSHMFSVGYGDKVTCTITNSRTPQLRLKKVFDPTTDTGKVDFTQNGVGDDNGGLGYGNNGTTAFKNALGDNNTASEAGHTGTDLGDYVSTWSCDDAANTSGTGTAIVAADNLDLGFGAQVTCTFTNHRKPQIKVVKDVVPNSDTGTFDLSIDATSYDNMGAGFGDNGTTGFHNVGTGSHTVSELGHGTTSLGDYASKVECDSAKGSDDPGTSHMFSVGYGDKVTCTITNSRTPQLRLKKVFDPTTDTGKVDFTQNGVGDDNGGLGYGNNGTTAFKNALGDNNTASEAGHTGTDLGDYVSTWSCDDAATTSGTGTAIVAADNLDLGFGAQVTCTFTNHRKPQIKVVKDVVPNSDTGTFDLSIDATSYDNMGAGFGDNGTTGFHNVGTGSHTVSELGHGTTSLGDYASKVECDSGKGSDDPGTSHMFSVGYGDKVTCTITNSRTPQLRLKKVFDPTTDTGKVDFTQNGVGDDNGGLGYGNNGTTAFKNALGDNNTASEAGHTGTDLGDYVSTWSCDDAANTSGTGTAIVAADNLDLGFGAQVTCTFTNHRKPQIKVVKDLVPNSDTGTFDLSIDATSYDNMGAGFGDNGTTGFHNVGTGSHTVSELGHGTTSLGDYASKVECDSAKGSDDPGTSHMFSVGYGDKVTCTITNSRTPQLRLKKVFDPTTDTGKVDFTQNGVGDDNGGLGYGNNGTTAFKNALGDNNTASEAGHTGTDLGDYVSTWSCDDAATTSGTGTAIVAADNLDLGFGAQVTCTFTNHRKPQIKVVKDVVPNSDTGTFDLSIDATSYDNMGAGFGDNGTTGFHNVGTGSHTVSELGHGTTSLGDYASKVECDSAKGSDDPGTSHMFSVGYGDKVTCTITNSRTPQLRLKKVFDPTTDTGKVDFTQNGVGDDNGGLGYGNNGTTAFKNALGDNNTASEAGHTGTDLGDYVSTWSCDDAATTSGTGTAIVAADNLDLGFGAQVTCTFTNHRKPQIKVVKDVVPNSDTGTFDLSIDATSYDNMGAGFGDNGTTGFHNVGTGSHTVSEAGHTGTSLSKYSSSVYCNSGKGSASGTSKTFSVGYGDKVTCTITNTRNKGKLTVKKSLVPAIDSGRFDLSIDTTVVKANAGDGGSGFQMLDPGTYQVSEAGSTSPATNLGDYDRSVVCKDATLNVVASNATGSTVSVPVDSGDDITCTITNSRLPQIKVVKDLVPDTDPGRFDLNIDTTSYDNSGNGFGDNGTTNFHNVTTGSHTVEEFAHTGTSLSKYSSKVYCDSGKGSTNPGTSKTFTVGYGDKVTCTITNTRNKGKLTVKKTLVPAIDSGRFDLSIDTTVVKANAGDGGSGFQMLDPGTYSVSEAAGTTAPATVLSNYDRSVVCKDAGGTTVASNTTGAAINVSVDSNDDITCTFTNKRRPMLIVQKLIKPTGSLTSFQFQTTGTGYVGYSLAGGQQNSQTLAPGDYTAKEIVPLGWVLTGIGGSSANPFSCTVTGSGGSTGTGSLQTQTVSVSLKYGDTVTCVFENTGQGVTRTQGFWATHPQLANIAWFGGSAFGHDFGSGVAGVAGIGDKLLCPGLNPPVTAAKNIDTLGKLMGAFWSGVSKKSTGAQRSNLDQARMQLMQQLIAAELNAAAFGTQPSVGSFAAWESAYCGSNQSAINTAKSQAASFNTAGDSGKFTPGTSADSQGAKQGANLAFWDILP